MTRLLILMGSLAALLSACGPPNPDLMAQESDQAVMDNPRGAYNDDVGDIPPGF